MSLLTLNNISLAYGHHQLLDKVSATLDKGERVALVGRNGGGKSTLLKVIAKLATADAGEVRYDKQARIGYLPQEPEISEDHTVFDNVAEGLGPIRKLLSDYHHAVAALSDGVSDEKSLNKLHEIQEQLEANSGWAAQTQIEQILTQLRLSPDVSVATLSGGGKRRVALARALVAQPSLLLLDEPTNHLDVDTIQAMEETLREFSGALLFVTHDRRFLQDLATRIFELDRGRLSEFPGDYATYLAKKQHMLEVETQQNALFDKRLAQEEVWIRTGIQARRTRNEGRVRALKALRVERGQRRERVGQVRLAVELGEQSGKVVLEAEHISYAYDGKTIVTDFSARVLRGDRIGVIGPNGIGKTTLLKLLLQKLIPASGIVRHGTKLDVAYFDQLRAQLDPEMRVVDCIGRGSESITINGKSKHVISYLADFLFPPERARSPIKALSGGERNRLLLAQMFTKPANVLILDEPTNDLDIETLELLEELLVDFPGTLFLVSHDREFLDNVVTSCWAFEGSGKVSEYVGGYSDWLRQRPAPAVSSAGSARARTELKTLSALAKTAVVGTSEKKPKPSKKLSYKHQRELEELPARIEQLEQERDRLQQQLANPQLYKTDPSSFKALTARLEAANVELEQAYARWQEMEAQQG